MKALSTSYSPVEFREESVGRWGVRSFVHLRRAMCDAPQFHIRGQRRAAEFSFAGVIAHADDERTGNLVPDGEEPPLGLDSRKM